MVDSRFPAREDVMVVDLLEARAREHGDRVFLVFDDGEEWSFARTATEAWQVANSLRAAGVREGDYVSMWLPAGKDSVRTFLGILGAGAVFAPLNVAYRGELLAHALEVTGSSLLIAHPQLVPRLRGLRLGSLQRVVVLGPNEPSLSPDSDIEVDGDELRGGSDRPLLEHPREPWDDMCLMFTSGTTGPSKGVLQSYLFYHRFCRANMGSLGVDDRYYGIAPTFHNGWPLILTGMLRVGGSVYVTDDFNTRTFWRDAQAFGVTAGYLLGSMATILMKNGGCRDHPIRHLRVTPNVPDPLEFKRLFGVLPGSTYGSTEVGLAVVTEPGELDPRTAGVPRPGYELRVVDEHDREVPPGTPGELIVRHDAPWALSSGYRGMPAATAEAWRNGWFHTGDVVRRDSDGRVFFVDRVKDVIRRRGENISSAELETEVLRHPSVVQCAAYAVPTGDGDEDVMISVILRGDETQPDELISFLTERVPHYMVPRYIDVVADFPLTATGRVQKSALRERGVSPGTWDREAAGISVKRKRLHQ